MLAHVAPGLTPLLVPIDSVEVHPRNAREGDVGAISESLTRFGQLKPIVAQRSSGYIVAGNHLWKAAKALGWAELAVVLVDLDAADELAYVIADNRTSDLGTYNEAALSTILTELASLGSLEGTGYDGDDVDALLQSLAPASPKDPDDVPTVPEAPDCYVKPGDIYRLGPHRVLCGSSADPEAVARLLGDQAVDLVFTDPPYGVSYEGKTSDRLTVKNDELAEAPLTELIRSSLALSQLRPGGPFYVCAPAGDAEYAFLTALRLVGWQLRQKIVWVKDRFVLGRSDYHYRHEDLLTGETPDAPEKEGEVLAYGWASGAAHTWNGGRRQSTVWEINRPGASREHPTMKPVELCERAILNSSDAGAHVYDPFGGSGSTLIAAEKAGRRCSVVELDPRYAQVVIERWQTYTGKQAERA